MQMLSLSSAACTAMSSACVLILTSEGGSSTPYRAVIAQAGPMTTIPTSGICHVFAAICVDSCQCISLQCRLVMLQCIHVYIEQNEGEEGHA